MPTEQSIERLRRGVTLEDGTRTAPAEITLTGETETNAWYKVVLHEGRNQQIRRMFDSVGHSVIKLRRVRIGHLKDEGMRVGEFRLLTPEEVARFTGRAKKSEGGKSAKKSAGKSAKKPVRK